MVLMNKSELYNALQVILIREAKYAMNSAQKAHDIVLSNIIDKNCIALSFLNKACTHISTAKSIYFTRYDMLKHYDVESVFSEFNSFVDEFLRNEENNLNHDTSDIYFERLKAAYKDSILSKNNMV
jgi:sulfur relay (sulfurtransferase) DsrF/TusC family protein